MSRKYLFELYVFLIFTASINPTTVRAASLSVISAGEYHNSIWLSTITATDYTKFMCSNALIGSLDGVTIKFEGDNTVYNCDGGIHNFSKTLSARYADYYLENNTTTTGLSAYIVLYDGATKVGAGDTSFLAPGVKLSVDVANRIDVSLKGSKKLSSFTAPVTYNASGVGSLVFSPVGASEFKLTDGEHEIKYIITPDSDASKVIEANKSNDNGSYSVTFNPQSLSLFPGKYTGALNVTLSVQ